MNYTDVEMAILSQLAYQDVKEGETLWSALLSNKGYLEKELGTDYKTHISGLISRVKDNGCYIVKAQTNTSSGFSAFAIKDPINNNVVVACRGTELGKLLENPIIASKDLYEDVSLTLSQQTLQQKDMDAFMNVLQKGGYDEYSFTGHSLGGNLAMYGAITLKDKSKLKECKTFNAPGFNKDFHKKYKKEIAAVEAKETKTTNGKEKSMISYQNKYDGISEALDVPGEKVVLESKKKKHDGITGHAQDDFVIDGNGFKKAKSQKKSVTLWGLLLKYGGEAVENRDSLGSISRFKASYSPSFDGVSVVTASGNNRIKLTPAELKGQASQMLALGNEFEQLFDGVVSDLNSVNRSWSANLANNFSGKITSAQGRFKHISDMLASGAAVANLSANNYEEADSLLTKVVSGDLFKQDEGSIVGVLRNSGNI